MGCEGDHDNHDNHPPPPVCLLPCIEAAGVRRREELTPEMICGFLDHLYETDQCVGDCDAFETERIHAFMGVGCVMEDFEDPAGEYFYEEIEHEFEEPQMYDHYMPAGSGYMPEGTFDYYMPTGGDYYMPAASGHHEPHMPPPMGSGHMPAPARKHRHNRHH